MEVIFKNACVHDLRLSQIFRMVYHEDTEGSPRRSQDHTLHKLNADIEFS